MYVFLSDLSFIIQDGDAFRHPDTGANYPSNWDKGSVDGLEKVRETPMPTDAYVTGMEVVMVDGAPTQRWITRPFTAEELRRPSLDLIAKLEMSITDRMWREDAVGSTALMEIKKQDENGDWVVDNDDPRTGKTATQYIAYVNSAISNIRAGL